MGAGGVEGGIIGEAFDAEIDAVVMVFAVAVFFAVGLVMFVFEGNEVGEGEAVVGGDEIDGVQRAVVFAVVEVGAASEAGGEVADRVTAVPEAADVVAEFPVPVGKAFAGEVADLIAAAVPGFGDELGVFECRFFFQCLEKRRVFENFAVFAAA